MKKILLILLATLCATMAFGQGKYRATIGIPIYNKPNTYSFGSYIDSDSIFDLGTKTGKFWQVTYKDKLRYMPQDWKKYCTPADSIIPNKPSTIANPINKSVLITPGGELYSAGKLLLSSTIVGIGGGVLSYVLLRNNPYSSAGVICGIGTGIATLVLQIAGYRKLMKAGEKINIGATSSGIGMTINLNPAK